MTQEENQYYQELKANPSLNQYVFDKLFTIINGNTVAKQGIAFKFLAGVPYIYNTMTEGDVFQDLFPQDMISPLLSNQLATKRVSPFAASPLSKNGADVRDAFFWEFGSLST